MKTISIGRDDQCDIVIVDKTNVVSRRHAVIMIDSYGRMTITDYSANGTYINGIKMSQNVAVPITRKDTVSFAHTADLDWRLVPDVRGKLIKLVIAIGICVAAIVVALCILLKDEIPQINEDTEKNDTISHKDRKAEEDQHKKDTVEFNLKKEDVNMDDANKPKDDANKPKDKDHGKHDGKDQGKAGGKKGHKTDKQEHAEEETAPVDPIIM